MAIVGLYQGFVPGTKSRSTHVFLKRGKEKRPKTACLSSPHTLRQYAQGTHDAVSGIDRE